MSDEINDQISEIPTPTVDEALRPSKEQALALMQLAMPSFEKFLEHSTVLKNECEKAEALTPERAKLFDQYTNALNQARVEYEDTVMKLICEQFSTDEINILIDFYTTSVHLIVEKALGFSTIIHNIGVAWRTRVFERCPDVWKMLMENVGEWQRKNTPENCEVILPDAPPNHGRDGWKLVSVPSDDGPKQAEEFIP